MTKSITKLAHNLNNYLLSYTKQTKYLTCFFILLFSSMGWGQNFATIGSGTNETTSNGSDPIWGYWGSFRYQVVYTAAELTSAGLASGASISALGFSISGDYAGGNLLGYTIKMGHTSATNSAAHDASTTSTVKNAFSYNPSVTAAGAFDMITLDASFVWNGTSNILIDICSSGPNPYTSPYGKVRTIALSTTDGSRSIGNDGVGSLCGTTTSSTNSTKPQIRFAWVAGASCSGTPAPGTIASNTSQNVCSGATPAALTVSGFTSGVSGITFQWEQSSDDITWTTAVGGSGATTATYTPPVFAGTTIYYRCNVTCANGGGTAATPSVSINPPANPSTQVTNAVASAINYTSFTTTWVNGNGNRRVVYISTAPIVEPSNGTGAAAPTVNSVYAGSGQQIVYDDTGTTVTVTGLALGTTYYVKVFEYTRCGTTTFDYYYNTTSGTNAISVTTISPTAVPWNEGFATGVATFPNWQTTSGAAVGTATGLAALSSNYWYVNLYSSLTTAAVTTPIIGSIPSNYRFVVKYNLANYDDPYAPPSIGSGNFIVAISTDNGSSYTDVETIANNAVDGWQEYVLNLSAYVGQNIRIRLTGNRTSGDYHLAFDNFSVEAIPSCLPPNTLVLSSITNNSASLSWTAPATAPAAGYEVYYSTTNTAPLAGTTASASVASGTTYSFFGLTASTTYYSWVRSNCGSGDVSTWAASASFTTLCNPISSFPYSENFDGVTTPALPNCWSVLDVNNDTDKWITYTGYSQSGNNSVGLYTDYNAGANNDFLISPQFNLSGIKRLKYSVRARSSGEPNDYRVLLSTTGSSASDFSTVLLPLTSVSSTSYTEVIIDLSMYSGNIFIAFNVPSGGLDGYYIYIDDVIIEDTPNTWTGTTSNSWNTSGNWSLGTVPTSSDNIVISSNTPNAPVMDVDVTIPAGKSLRINSSGTLTIAPGKVLTIAGTANFNGKAVTFKSDATGTAMLGPLTGSLTNATNVTVERYIPLGKRAFRLLSPAVTTTTFISGNWQQQTHITGGASGGFDATETNNPSMYTYNNQAAQGVSGWTPILNTNATNLTAGVGYRVLIRGDKTPANITSASANEMNAAITLSATGTLRTGTVPLSSSSTPSINNTANTITDGHSLVGNPYQSAVDWHLVTRTDIDATYWAWDPNMGTSIQRGRYVSYNVSSGNNSNVDSQVGRYIQPGQAFFVKNTGPSAGTLTFEEAHKATTNANVFRSANTPNLGVALYDPNELAIGGYPIDATKAVFSSDYSNELGLGDATKLEAAGENIAWFRNNTKLAIDAAAPVTTSDELAMKTMRLGANKNYTFKIQTTNFDTALTPYLVDNFLNTQTAITTSQAYLASFATTSNQASYSEDRFKIVFQTSALSTDDFVKSIKLYPNPAKAGGSFYIDGITEATVSVYNVVGQNIPVTVMSQGNAIQVTPSASLSNGVYLVSITSQGVTKQVKWIVE